MILPLIFILFYIRRILFKQNLLRNNLIGFLLNKNPIQYYINKSNGTNSSESKNL